MDIVKIYGDKVGYQFSSTKHGKRTLTRRPVLCSCGEADVVTYQGVKFECSLDTVVGNVVYWQATTVHTCQG